MSRSPNRRALCTRRVLATGPTPTSRSIVVNCAPLPRMDDVDQANAKGFPKFQKNTAFSKEDRK